jgi:MoxR-like ATPase
MDIAEASATTDALLDELASAVITDRDFLETALMGFVARGHVLLEDVPGTGKTLTARSVAGALGLSFSRVQFTPDLLPSDVTGTHVYDESTGEFDFSAGPIFANVVLADEINRAPPKTQSALLEAMEERQATVDGTTYELPDPFFVIATQNPVDMEGTFELPEAQVDRFLVKASMGYPDDEGELELLRRRRGRSAMSPSVDAVLDDESASTIRETPESVTVDDDILQYEATLARATRDHDAVSVGVSPRGTQRLFEAARARAAMVGREYVTPEDVTRVAHPAMAHRLVLTADARIDGRPKHGIIDDVLDSVAVPTV